MRGIAHHRHRPEAIAAVDSLLDGVQRLDRQVRFDIRVDESLGQPQRDDESALSQAYGELLTIAADVKMLLSELLQELFAFDLHQEAPQTLARARNARLEETDLALPLGTQKIVVGIDLAGL